MHFSKSNESFQMTQSGHSHFIAGLEYVVTPKRGGDAHTEQSKKDRHIRALNKLGRKGYLAGLLFRLGIVGEFTLLTILIFKCKPRAHTSANILIADHASQPLGRHLYGKYEHLSISLISDGPSVIEAIRSLPRAWFLLKSARLLADCSTPRRYHGLTYILYFVVWERYLATHTIKKALFCDDFTAPMVALYTALKLKDVSLLVLTMHKRPWPYLPPGHCDVYLHWGELPQQDVSNICAESVVLHEQTKVIDLSRLKKRPVGDLRVLVVLNAFFPLDSVFVILEFIEIFGDVVVRPHPRSEITALSANTAIKIENGNRIEDIARNFDLAVCASTSAAPQLLEAGCPVVYDQRLDPDGMWDEYRYVQTGKFPEMSYSEVNVQLISAFYDKKNAVHEQVCKTAPETSWERQIAVSLTKFLQI